MASLVVNSYQKTVRERDQQLNAAAVKRLSGPSQANNYFKTMSSARKASKVFMVKKQHRKHRVLWGKAIPEKSRRRHSSLDRPDTAPEVIKKQTFAIGEAIHLDNAKQECFVSECSSTVDRATRHTAGEQSAATTPASSKSTRRHTTCDAIPRPDRTNDGGINLDQPMTEKEMTTFVGEKARGDFFEMFRTISKEQSNLLLEPRFVPTRPQSGQAFVTARRCPYSQSYTRPKAASAISSNGCHEDDTSRPKEDFHRYRRTSMQERNMEMERLSQKNDARRLYLEEMRKFNRSPEPMGMIRKEKNPTVVNLSHYSIGQVNNKSLASRNTDPFYHTYILIK